MYMYRNVYHSDTRLIHNYTVTTHILYIDSVTDAEINGKRQ